MKFTASLFLLLAGIPALFAGAARPAAAQSAAARAPQASITVTPSTAAPGQSVTVQWNSSNATAATINGSPAWTAGTYTGVPPYSGALTITVTGPGGTAKASAQVTVQTPASIQPSNSSTAPHINYTDLNVGSGAGGDDGNGVYVRLFGSHFGPTQNGSTVALGGNLVTNCAHCSWSDTQITAQLGGAASTGNIVVRVNNQASNGIPFTVVPTNIVFISPQGSDNNTGTYQAPFRTWRAAFNAVTSGDNSSPSENTVIYFEPGVADISDDGRGYRAAASTDLGGSSTAKQLALVGYPGGTATIGSTQVDNGIHGWGKYLTIADLTLVGTNSAIDAESGDIRIVNNDISCPAPPKGLGGTACVLGETDNPSDTWVFEGNKVHDTGGNVDKTYHAVYFSSNVDHADVGWNAIGDNFKGYCRSIMFHATTGSNLYDLHVHDNTITGGYCDAIGFASVDPSKGVVEAYNNVISHVAIASNPYGVANEAGIAVNSDPAAGTSGTVQIYNNTVTDAGGYTQGNQNGCFGVVTDGAGISLINNICSQLSSSEPYIEAGSQNVSGSNNLWYGAGPAPSWDAAPKTAAPGFVSATNLALQPSSPALRSGSTAKTSATDVTGTQRPDPPSIGAFE